MDKDPEETFFQRRHANDHEKVFNVINIREMQMKTTM